MKKRKKKSSPLPIVIIGLIIALMTVATMYVKDLKKPVNINDTTTKQISIEDGTPSSQIAKILKENGVIKSEKYFLFFAKKENLANLKSGVYELSASQDLKHILEQLNTGGRPVGEKVTIKEGTTIKQIAKLLSQQGLANEDNFIKISSSKDVFVSDFPFLNDSSITSLEGFLYPETYFIKKGTSEEDIIRQILSQTQALYTDEILTIPENLKPYVKNINELVALASIVEKETTNKKDAPLVAGVFVERLKTQMPLQSCVTVEYVTGVHKQRISYEDSRIDSPFNTYINKGLTPTPICTPTVDTINAVKNFTPTDYLYFVAKTDGSLVFSKTYEQHLEETKKIYGEY